MPQYRRLYTPGATYAFTVTLTDRKSQLLIDEIDRFRRSYNKVKQRHPFSTIAFCILPDHLHVIWRMPENDANFSLRWNKIKSNFSRGLPAFIERSESQYRHREKGIWQRRFWEHQIRDEDDLVNHINYIHQNPVKHGYVKNAKDWQYSSIHYFVES
jgi:putative transposase